MWKDIRPELCAKAKEMEDLTRDWIKTKLSEGKLIGFIARTQAGVVAGSGCIWLREDAPRPFNACLESPYLMSMYTEEAFRRTGVASMIVQCAIEWSREHGYKSVSLHASNAGAPLYERFGFKLTTEMRLML
jgi:GNAT superfamily N-acetyltransferase